MNYDTIVVLDFGSQYNQLIVRRFREIGVYAELWPHTSSVEKLTQSHIKGVVLSGGPQSLTDKDSMKIDEAVWSLNVPILGICYGMQLMVHACGGQVQKAEKGEYGACFLNIADVTHPLLQNIQESIVWMSHQDDAKELPVQWQVVGSTENCKVAVVSDKIQRRLGIQFHPEVSHTRYGMQVLKNFAIAICNATAQWSMKHYVHTLEEEVKAQVGDARVICGLSGGVDSAVTAAILQRAIGQNLHCIYVDHGLMRAGESEEVERIFGEMLGSQFLKIDASEQFFAALQGISDPEKKRKVIGHEFINVFAEVAMSVEHAEFLAQGTLYTDIVESGKGGSSQTIKSHHNVGGLPKDMKLKLVEPLKTLYKDEVRALGMELGLPESMVQRQPFPGPGLGIRILGEINREKVKLVQDTDLILREEIARASLDKEVWQYFTVLPGIKTVGVKGDQRSYNQAIIIRAICSVDGMTANVAELPYSVLHKISRRITNEVDQINRVLFDITDKPPGTIEFE